MRALAAAERRPRGYAAGLAADGGERLVGGEARTAMRAEAAAGVASARAAARAALAEREGAGGAGAGQERERLRADAVSAAEAEWVVARATACEATGELAHETTEWARERPEFDAARHGNTEGAGAGAEAVECTEPASFVATQRVQCSLGTPGEPWEDGKRRKLPSREEGAWEAVRRRLPTWLGAPEAETAEEGAVLGV